MSTNTIERVRHPHHDPHREVRVAGVPGTEHHDDGTVDDATPAGGHGDETVARRRELLGIGSLVLCAVVGASLRADLYPGGHRPLIDPGWLRSATVAVAACFLAYALAQEHRLRAIDAQHAVELSHATVAASRMLVAVAVADAASRVHASLLVDDVIATVLDEVRRAVEVDGVELRLIGLDGRARRAGARGTVAAGDDVATTSFPLYDGCRRLGSIEARGSLDASEREVLVSLAGHGARALANARVYEDALNRLGEIRDCSVAHVVDTRTQV